MPTWRDNRRGIIALVISMAAFSVNDTVIKYVMRDMPAGEAIFVRGIFSVAMLGVAVVVLGHHRTFRHALTGIVLLRALTDGLASGLFVVALAHMRIADVSTVLLTVPLLLTASSVVLYGERVGWRRWSAVGAGFLGVLLVVKPTPAAFDSWALVALAAAVASASRDLLTRHIGDAVPTISISFLGSWLVAVTGLVMMPGESWRPPDAAEIAWLALAAGFLGFATYFATKAFRGVDISIVAPFRYTLLLFALLAGFLVFDELPDVAALTGALLIVGSGLYVLRRETLRAQPVEKSSVAPVA